MIDNKWINDETNKSSLFLRNFDVGKSVHLGTDSSNKPTPFRSMGKIFSMDRKSDRHSHFFNES
ncbi:hypothetical protein BIFDEN_01966 [Bifidobacterium dentium ATCC 27678]|nr:hypothetical protein BIFDEN_01966 [Bifidobacterium dentium ATCC 27678]